MFNQRASIKLRGRVLEDLAKLKMYDIISTMQVNILV